MGAENSVVEAYLHAHPAEAAGAMEGRTPEDSAAFLDDCAPAAAAAVLAQMGRIQAANCLRLMVPEQARQVLSDLGAAQAAPMLRPLPADDRERLIHGLGSELEVAMARALAAAPGSVGEVMDPHPFSIPDDLTIRAARKRVRQAGAAARKGIFLVNRDGGLLGVVPFRDLILAEGTLPISSVVDTSIGSAPVGAPVSAVLAHPSWAAVGVLPVVDDHGRLAGTVSREDLGGASPSADNAALAGPLGTTLALGELYFVSAARLVGAMMTANRATREEDE